MAAEAADGSGAAGDGMKMEGGEKKMKLDSSAGDAPSVAVSDPSSLVKEESNGGAVSDVGRCLPI